MNEQAIFTEALDRPPEQRPVFLDGACRGNPLLRQRVEKLLAAHQNAASFMKGPAAAISETATLAEPQKPGTKIGPYTIREQIGEGGFGLVYVAEQMRPMRRRVALKIIKPGMDSKEVIARFEAERQALALMNHPNVARVFDAGATDAGRPYFVMELVHGLPLTEFCDKNKFTMRDRLELFMQVCQAVHHAHQKGFIHRDLKPNNILVTLHDGKPVPKVIDFGVAKALSQQLTEKTVYTSYGQVIGTPQYMSPEQAELSGLGIDTRSDIYSLGVLLYELLTGTPPVDRNRLLSSGYAEMMRIIREEEPPRPSKRVSTLGQKASAIAQHRRTDERKLQRSLAGELDWIVMKSLEKDRERRYDTAASFTADVQRYLRDEAVHACPPSTSYRLRKLIRRHRGKFLAASALLATLLLGLIGTSIGVSWAFNEKNKALQLAIENIRTKEQMRRWLYSSDMQMANRIWHEGGDQRVKDLLTRHVPGDGEEDLRGFEWYHLKWESRQRWRSEWTVDEIRAVPSPRGDLVAFVSYDGSSLILRDPSNFDVQEVIKTDLGYVEPTFSSRGNKLAYADGSDLVLRTLKTGELLRLNQQEEMNAIALSSDGALVAVQIGEKITVWDLESGEEYSVLDAPRVAGQKSHLSFVPGTRTISYCRKDSSLVMQAIGDTSPPQALRAPHEFQRAVYSTDGRLLLACTKNELCVVPLIPGEDVARYSFTDSKIHSRRFMDRVAFARDGLHFAVGYRDGTIEIWDSVSKSLIETIQGAHASLVTAIWFSDDGDALYSVGMDGHIRAWDWNERDYPKSLTAEKFITAVGLSPDGTEMAVSSGECVSIWDLNSGAVRATPIQRGHYNASFSKNWIAASIEKEEEAGYVQFWDLAGPSRLERFRLATVPRWTSDPRISFDISDDGGLVATFARDGTLEVFDRSRDGKKQTAHCDLGWHVLLTLRISPNNDLLAIGHPQGIVSIWDLDNLSQVDSKQVLETSVSTLEFFPNGGKLAVSNADGRIVVWSFASEDVEPEFFGSGTSEVDSLAISPDGRRLYSGEQLGYLRVWDIPTCQEVFTFDQMSRVTSITVSNDGRKLGCGTWGSAPEPPQARIWRAPELPLTH